MSQEPHPRLLWHGEHQGEHDLDRRDGQPVHAWAALGLLCFFLWVLIGYAAWMFFLR